MFKNIHFAKFSKKVYLFWDLMLNKPVIRRTLYDDRNKLPSQTACLPPLSDSPCVSNMCSCTSPDMWIFRGNIDFEAIDSYD